MNRYLLLDIIRQTSIVKNRDYYLELIHNPNVNEISLSLQKDNLISFIKRLRNNSYYGKRLIGVTDVEIDTAPYEVLKQFPLSDKALMTEHYYEIRNEYFKGENCYTGGSTGSPFHFFAGKKQLSSLNGFSMFLWSFLADYDWNDNVIVVGGTSIGNKKSIRNSALHFLQRRKYVPGGDVNIENAKNLVELINDSKEPVFLYGYPSSICQYINLFESMDMRVDTNKIKRILTTSETLSSERKSKLEAYFQKNVVNLYGARDGGISAGSLDNKEFIYNGVDCFAESIEINGVKELVLTNFDSDAFPFVRYRIGDIADLEIKRDGYPFVLCNLQGRTRDLIHISPTQKIHGSHINKVFKDTSVEEYQIIQQKDYSCEIRIQTKNSFSESELNSISERFDRLFNGVPFRIVVVDKLERGKNSKLRNIISNVID